MRETRTDRFSGERRQTRRLAALLVTGAAVVAAGLALLPSGQSGASAPAVSPERSVIATSAQTTVPADLTLSTHTTTYSPVSTQPSLEGLTTTTTQYLHPVERPKRLVIPAINLDAELIEVGLLENGDMEVPPFGLVGWYGLGPTPGASGPAVIVGHVDTKSGPDVFYHLKDLEPGDEVYVYGEDRDTVTFTIDSKEQQLKSELPTGRIWSDIQEPVIRLITCGGDFDRSSGHYLSNVIVYGHLVK